MRDLLRNAFALLRSGRLVIIHLVGNAALLVAASLWLLIGEAHIGQLIFAAAAALAILFLAVWLHTATFEYAANPAPGNLRTAFRPSLLRMFWLLLGVAILFLLMNYADHWQERDPEFSGYLYAKAPQFLRPTHGEAVVELWLDRAFEVLYWFILPGLFLPLIAARVIGAPITSGFKTLLRWRYWLAMAVIVAVGVWIPQLLIGWVPFQKLGTEMASLIVRLSASYLLATAAWLVLVALLGYFVRINSQEVAGKTVA